MTKYDYDAWGERELIERIGELEKCIDDAIALTAHDESLKWWREKAKEMV